MVILMGAFKAIDNKKMLIDTLRTMINNSFKKSFYENKN